LFTAKGKASRDAGLFLFSILSSEYQIQREITPKNSLNVLAWKSFGMLGYYFGF
jgi:hypothetical protein